MRYDEIRQTITASSPDDWALAVVDGQTFLNRFADVSSGTGQRWMETDSHTYLATYRDDVDLRLAWGLPGDEDLTFEGFSFPDKSIDRHAVDGFWRGALVTRWWLLSVDGGRCYLPQPDSGQRVAASEVALSRLLQKLTRPAGPDFDGYLQQVGAEIVPD